MSIVDDALNLIYEMASRRNIVLETIFNKSDTMVDHCMKILIFGNKSTWSKELYDRLFEISVLNAKNRGRIRRQEFYDQMFSNLTTNDFKQLKTKNLYRRYEKIRNEYFKLKPIKDKITESDLIVYFDRMKNFFNHMAIILSTNPDLITRENVENLTNKYLI